MEIEVTTPHLYEETRIWFRFSEDQRRSHRDGLSIPQLGTDGLKRRFVESALQNGDPRRWFSPRSIGSLLKTYRRGLDSARGLVLLKTTTNHQRAWLETGRRFARLQLTLTSVGLTSHAYSQVLQEYPEMADLQGELNELLGIRDSEKIQPEAAIRARRKAAPVRFRRRRSSSS